MIDSLLFLPAVDGETGHVPVGPVAHDDAGDAEAAAAVAAARDGHAHAARGAWSLAAAALERSAVARDALVARGLAGPVVAARTWGDLATVHAAAGDLDAARAAFAHARAATRNVVGLPAEITAATEELDRVLGCASDEDTAEQGGAPIPVGASTEAATFPDLAGGLLWLDTADASDGATSANAAAPALADVAIEVVAIQVIDPDVAEPAASVPGTHSRIAAVDAAVALATGTSGARGVDGASLRGLAAGFASRLRRLIVRR